MKLNVKFSNLIIAFVTFHYISYFKEHCIKSKRKTFFIKINRHESHEQPTYGISRRGSFPILITVFFHFDFHRNTQSDLDFLSRTL